MTAERDRLRKHRDEVSKQFEDLARLRNTESEKLFARYKETSETAAKGQSAHGHVKRSLWTRADACSPERHYREPDDIERKACSEDIESREIPGRRFLEVFQSYITGRTSPRTTTGRVNVNIEQDGTEGAQSSARRSRQATHRSQGEGHQE